MTSHSASPTLPLTHVLLAVAITAIWGTNFIVIKVGLDNFPPLTFACLRFMLVFFPAALVVRRPKVPWSHLVSYGVLIGGGQFGLLYIAMNGYISPGLASVVSQSQVFFTIAIAIIRNNERPTPAQYITLITAIAGFLIIAVCGDADVTPIGLGLVLLAALSWAVANIIAKGARSSDMLGYVVWASLFAVPALLGLSLLMEGFYAPLDAIRHATPGAWASLLWQSTGNTLFCFSAWGWLLSQHPASSITPTALLVPVFGMGASVIALGETLPLWKVTGAGLIMLALCGPHLWMLVRKILFKKRNS